MTGPAADATRWLGHTHEEIYAMVQAGAGPAAAHGAEQFWTSTAGTLSATAAQLGGAIQAAGAGWEGVAADATATGAAPLAAWALDRATLARRTSATLAVQAGYVDHVRREMPVPAPPGGPEVAQLGAAPDLLSDWSAADLARQNAAERAVEIMDQYTYNAYDTLPGVEIGSMPPAVVVDQGGATPAATPAVAPAPTAAAAALPVPPALAPAPVAAAAAPAAMAAPPATAPVAPAGTAAITGPPRITGPTTVPGRNPATAPGVDGAGSAAGGRAARSGAPLPGGASELPATVVRSTPGGGTELDVGLGWPPGGSHRPGGSVRHPARACSGCTGQHARWRPARLRRWRRPGRTRGRQ
ncbi:PPE domain-containing protein [Pseudonocardia sp. GCM10023141]|uniref:PPE domain-containing protein n=1 Tax=Pseudonocardia sp. GCM10023141 TaxID=3252653 RepID=UPI0036089D9F